MPNGDLGDIGPVLVIDDDPGTRFLARETLEQDGFRVEEAENGREGIALARRVPPCLILLDVIMPEKDGFETCRELRQLAGQNHTPVLMMTGLDDVESINRAYEVGATDFITKPITWPVLTHRVRYILRASRAMEELAESRQSLAEAQRMAGLSSWVWDIERGRVDWSGEIYDVMGLTPRQITPSSELFWEHVHPEDREPMREAFVAVLKGNKPLNIDCRFILPDHTSRVIHIQGQARRALNGRAVRLQGVIQDVTERKRAEEQVRRLAFYDSLTGLPNRLLFREQLRSALESADRDGHQVAILFLDLDHFKRVNDELGHQVGDALLEEVARRLSLCLRSEDRVYRAPGVEADSLVARLGGDEFTIVLGRVRHAEDAAKVAQRILHVLSEPVEALQNVLSVSTSIGIAVYPDDASDIDTLIDNADVAMYHAKGQGRGRYQFFSEVMNVNASQKLEFEAQLRQAVGLGQMEMQYQPRYDARSGEIVSLEALMRWRHPVRGLLAASEFMLMAEETGVVIELGEWGVATACKQAKALHDQGHKKLRIAVNASDIELSRRDYAQRVLQACAEAELDPHFLEIELSETIVVQNKQAALLNLRELDERGVRVCLHDFGVRFLAMNYLKNLPISSVKIDRSLTQGVSSQRENAAIATAIITLAQNLKLDVVAQGVEDARDRRFLLDHGCCDMQGYLFSEAVPSAQLTEVLRRANSADQPSAA